MVINLGSCDSGVHLTPDVLRHSHICTDMYITIENIYLSYFTAGICIYAAAAGILLTIAGIKRTNITKEITISIEKRGVLS